MSAEVQEGVRRLHPFARKCQGCGKWIVWFVTSNGKRMPVDEETTEPTDAQHQLDLKRHVSHFATCPKAAEYRRKR